MPKVKRKGRKLIKIIRDITKSRLFVAVLSGLLTSIITVIVPPYFQNFEKGSLVAICLDEDDKLVRLPEIKLYKSNPWTLISSQYSETGVAVFSDLRTDWYVVTCIPKNMWFIDSDILEISLGKEDVRVPAFGTVFRIIKQAGLYAYVKNLTGGPIKNAELTLYIQRYDGLTYLIKSSTKKTDDDGKIIWRGLSPNSYYFVRYTISVDEPIKISKSVEISAGWNNITVILGKESNIFIEGFDSDPTVTFQKGWVLVKKGDSINQITRDRYYSPPNSLLLWGISSTSIAERQLNTSAKIIGFEAYISVESRTGKPEDVCTLGFWNREKEKYRVSLEFAGDQLLRVYGAAELKEIRSYERGAWYKIRVVVDRAANTFSVWINDVLQASDLKIVEPIDFNAIALGSRNIKCHYDNVRLFEID
jgi:hypothetical protein